MAAVIIFSLVAFLVTLTLHIGAMMGLVTLPLNIAVGAFFPLMVGAIVANAHVISQRRDDYITLPPGEFWRFISENAPGWMRSLQIGLLLYAVFNFYFTMLVINQGGYPRLIDGFYVLERQKVVLDVLTYSQYMWHAGFVVRMLSSIVMAVYFAAIMRWVARFRTVGAGEMALPTTEEATS
jgi:hypothetical protein